MKYYKNLTGHQIKVVLYGLGEIVVPAEAKCVELNPSAADAINSMARPNVLLEEVTPTITFDDEPVVTKKTKKKKTEEELDDVILDVEE